ncbi:hypothetical protein LX36DRAFT_380567 [Colletotrichum falcatum]|nr:hypothetical protein LX36DRAFT_380567 [Colletotrichum falcatum]
MTEAYRLARAPHHFTPHPFRHPSQSSVILSSLSSPRPSSQSNLVPQPQRPIPRRILSFRVFLSAPSCPRQEHRVPYQTVILWRSISSLRNAGSYNASVALTPDKSKRSTFILPSIHPARSRPSPRGLFPARQLVGRSGIYLISTSRFSEAPRHRMPRHLCVWRLLPSRGRSPHVEQQLSNKCKKHDAWYHLVSFWSRYPTLGTRQTHSYHLNEANACKVERIGPVSAQPASVCRPS